MSTCLAGINPNNHGQWLDGTAVEYNNFCPGEPNGGGPGRIYMWGAKFDNDNYCWDDRGTTSDNYGYICEKDKGFSKFRSVLRTSSPTNLLSSSRQDRVDGDSIIVFE